MGLGFDDDEYPFEGPIRNQPPPFMGDDGFNNNSYVLKTQRVVQFVRPVVTRQVYVNGKPVKEERFVGDYQPYSYGSSYSTNNALTESLDNLGIINGFLGQAQMEAGVSPRDGATAFQSRRPAAPAAAESKPNWGSRAAWVAAAGDDSSFSGYTEYPDQARNLYHFDSESNKPNWGARPNWPNGHFASPPGSPVHSKQGSITSDSTKPYRVFQDNSPTRYGDRFEPSHPMHHFEREDQRQDSPPLKQLERLDTKDNSSQESSPIQNKMDAYMTRSGSTKVVKDENVEAENLSRSDSESNKPNWGARPNWPNSRLASPPGSPVLSKQGTLNSDNTKTNFQDSSPSRSGDRFEPSRHANHSKREEQRQDSPPLKHLERLDIKDNNNKNSQGSSPNQKMMDTYMARSEVVKNGNNDSLVKDNALQVKESDKSPIWVNRKSQDQEKSSYESEGKKMENGQNHVKNQMANLDDGYDDSTKESSNKMTTKPRLYGGWYQSSRGLQGGDTLGTTTTRHWREITPNPPVELTKPTLVEPAEAMRRYAYMTPAMAKGYFDAVSGYYKTITSEDAVKKYGGFFIPPS